MEVAEMLIKSGADVNFPREDGETPIHMAARGGNVKTFKLLLEEGGDVRKTSAVSEVLNVFGAKRQNSKVNFCAVLSYKHWAVGQ